MLSGLISEFEIIPSLADEEVVGEVSPRVYVEELAKRKALEVSIRPENEGKIVIGSDTVVAFEEKILGKPSDEEDAFRMLKMLSGKEHAVYTGVCFACTKGGKTRIKTSSDKTAVYFNRLSNEWISEYVAGGSPMDKAGAYGIQDGGLVDKIEGSYTNVVGFPVELVEKMMREWL